LHFFGCGVPRCDLYEPVIFAGIFTTDGHRRTQMERGFLSVFISVHPWFRSFGRGFLPKPAAIHASPAKSNPKMKVNEGE
jgi:hypothetical protein